MRRREILVFVAAFAVVLLGGAALAQVGTFAGAPSSDAAALSMSIGEDTTAAPAPSANAAGTERSESEPTTTSKPPEDRSSEDTEPVEPPGDVKPPVTDPPKDEEPPADADETPPPLEILFPKNEQHFDEDHIAFEGKTEAAARVLAGPYEADVDDEGNWRIVLILSPGGNQVTFTAKDAAGNKTEASIKVYLDREKATEREFSAHQKWEAVDGYPAENKYYGTATPGTKVWVGSEYGDASTQADSSGEWLVRVKFPEAPCNETFKVVVEAEGNHRSEFRMKYVCASHEFTAHQKYGENESPWTKFYGTGVPGTTVWVGSDFGTAQTIVEGNGEWLVKLHFNDNLPANKEVGVVVEGEGGRAEFGFFWIVKETAEVEFTANQKYGSCGEAVPYDKFYGTAAPGSTIWVESPYGSGTTTAGVEGHWDIRVDFPEAPVGEPFTVVVESSDDGRATFTFTRTSGEGDK
jgi:hypothetical protein